MSQNLAQPVPPPAVALKPSTANSVLTLANDPAGMASLADMLAMCYETLNVYGKKPEQIETAVKLFSIVLAENCIGDVRKAFVAYLRNHRDMPTPSDIIGYIRREGRPPFDRSIYIALCEKRKHTAWSDGIQPWQKGDGLTDAETRYISDYERFEVI